MKFQASINGIKGTVQYRDEDVTGKSTLLAFLRQLSCGEILPGTPSSEEQDRTPITTIGIDGFHHYQSFLDTHTTVRDGQEILMARVKGAPETFDRALLEERIRKVAAGEDCSWPDYDRTIENPREDVFKIDASSKIVVESAQRTASGAPDSDRDAAAGG